MPRKTVTGGKPMENNDVMYLSPENLPFVLKVKEFAALMRMPLSRAYELVECGQIPCIRIGKSIRIPRNVVLKMLETKEEQAQGASALAE